MIIRLVVIITEIRSSKLGGRFPTPSVNALTDNVRQTTEQ
jgi:hypothetical protein